MKIRKKYRVESAHVVRNCTSERCSHSIHGHSAEIEVILQSYYLDNAQMVYDFGLMKNGIGEFIDLFDHCYILCSKDSEEFKEFIKKSCDRWIEIPFNPSAEMLSLFMLVYVNRIIDDTNTRNGEDDSLVCLSVRYHETASGYAEADLEDADLLWSRKWENEIKFSPKLREEMLPALRAILDGENVVWNNPEVEQQINLKD